MMQELANGWVAMKSTNGLSLAGLGSLIKSSSRP
jgi:hypothetical protein